MHPNTNSPMAIAALRATVGEQFISVRFDRYYTELAIGLLTLSPRSEWRYKHRKHRIADQNCRLEERTHFELWRLIGCTVTSVEIDEICDVTLFLSDGAYFWFRGKGTGMHTKLW